MKPAHIASVAARLWLGLVLILIWSLPAYAAEARAPHTFKGELQVYFGSSGKPKPCQELSEKSSPLVAKICVAAVKVRYRLSLLMGDPVATYQVAWDIDPTIYLRPGVTLDGKAKDFTNAFTNLLPQTLSVDTQSAAVQKAFAALRPIFPTRFVINSYNHQGHLRAVHFEFDAGDLNRSGKGFGFNVTDGPNWDAFILENDFKFLGPNPPLSLPYVSADEAKDLYRWLDDNFEFDRILNLTFAGVYELNSALRGEQVYPFTVKVYPANSLVTLFNSASGYSAGMMLKAGRYRVQVSSPGFKPVERWLTLNEQHTTFDIRLQPEKKAPQQPSTPRAADQADDLDAMLSEIETPTDKAADSAPASADTPAQSTADTTASSTAGRDGDVADSLEAMLDEVGQQDAARAQQAEAQAQAARLDKLKNDYDAAVHRCNADKPIWPKDYFCNTFHLVACGRNQSRDECRRDNEAFTQRLLRECAQEQAKVEREQKKYPQRLAAWTRENQQCLQKARIDYDAAVRRLHTTRSNIDALGNSIQ